MRVFLIFLMSLILISVSFSSISKPLKSFKLAIFDNPEIDSTDPSIAKNTKDSYIEGVDTAIQVAHESGIIINKKKFFYGDNLLNILQQAPNVNSWNPDVIVGLNSSNADILSSTLFSKQLVLSISATDINISKFPNNFYSLGLPDLYTSKQIVNFINTKYRGRNLFFIVGADSKESVDFSNIVANLYKKENPNATIIENKFLSDDANTMDIAKLIKGYKPGDIILLFAISGAYNTELKLMNNISKYLYPNKLIFISTSDNWRNEKILENTNDTSNPYIAYRFESLYIDKNSGFYKNFSKKYVNKYHHLPTNNISFITYKTVMSVVTALERFPANIKSDPKQSILFSYHKALNHDPNWFRYKPYVVYKIENNQEKYFTSLPKNG